MSRYLRLCLMNIRAICSRHAAQRSHPPGLAPLALVGAALVAQIALAALPGRASAAASASASASAAATSVPALDHVFTIVMENKTSSEILGDTADAPYINNTLIPSGALATNYDAVTHPSLPNYIALTAGSTLGVTTDCDPSSCSVSGPNIAGATLAAGKTWKAYEEGMPSNCAQSNSGEYAVRHNPFAYFTNLPSCAANDVPYSQLSSDLRSASATPSYAFITPNLIDDMHDGSIAQGDAWLKATVPTILNSPAFTQQHSLLVITWDEDDNGDVPNRVITVFLGYGITPGAKDGTAYTHYSLLKTTEQALGLSSLTSNDANATPMAGMFTASSSTPPSPPTATATATTPVNPSPTTPPSPTPTQPSTVTPTPPAPTTPTPTPSAPPAGALFTDNFETDTLGAAPHGWTAVDGSSWTVQPDGGNVLQQGDPDTSQLYTITAGSATWTNYTFQASVKPGANDLSQTTDLMARYTDMNNHYSFLLKNNSEWYLGMRSNGNWTTFAQGVFAYSNQFYTLALTVNGKTISGAINGKVVATATDATLSSGQIAFSTSATSELDNALVTSTLAAPGSGAQCAEVVNGALTVGTCQGTFTPLLASLFGASSDGTLCVEQQDGSLTIGKCKGTFTPS